ncbi:MAG: hypothetical protein ABF584_01480 [Acetobacter sp.]
MSFDFLGTAGLILGPLLPLPFLPFDSIPAHFVSQIGEPVHQVIRCLLNLGYELFRTFDDLMQSFSQSVLLGGFHVRLGTMGPGFILPPLLLGLMRDLAFTRPYRAIKAASAMCRSGSSGRRESAFFKACSASGRRPAFSSIWPMASCPRGSAGVASTATLAAARACATCPSSSGANPSVI